MNLNEDIRFQPSKVMLGNILFGTIKIIKPLIKMHKIQLLYSNIDELNKISIFYDYEAFEILLLACFVYIKSITLKKTRLTISCNRLLLNDNGFYSLTFLSQLKNSEDTGGVFSSSFNSGVEDYLTITNSVGTEDVIKDFLIDYSNKLNIKLEIKDSENSILVISLIS